ncbi:MAG: hypothetical protein RLY58_212 [Pseudomonadota bacterium]|jgi:hypothetical protein
MSTDARLDAIAVLPQHIPTDFADADALQAFLADTRAQSMPDDAHKRSMTGWSTDNRYEAIMDEVGQMANLRVLSFLHGEHARDRLETDDSTLAVSVIDGESMHLVIDALKQLLNPAEPWFGVFMAVWQPYGFDVTDVFAALEEADINPLLTDDEGRGGDTPFYVFRCLKTLLMMLEYAYKKGLDVLYVIECSE